MTDKPTDDNDGWEVEVEYVDVPAGNRPAPDLADIDESIIAEAESRFETLSKALDEQLAAIDELTSAMDVLQTPHRSDDGDITATVDVGGLLNGLTLTEEAMRQSPGALAHAIVVAAQEAQAEHTARLERTRRIIEQFQRPRSAS